jgi:transcriptional regulator with XRE-family HTH domain
MTPITPQELQERRKALSLSQAKLAMLLGVDVMTVSRWERGVREIPPYLSLTLEALEYRASRHSL